MTSNDGRWKWEVGNRDLVNFSFVQPYRGPWDRDYQDLLGNYVGLRWKQRWDPIAQVKVMFNQESAKQERSWVSGLSWGFQLNVRWPGPYPGGILVISQIIEPIRTQGVGPNHIENPGSQKVMKANPTQGATTLSPMPFVFQPWNQLNETEALGPLSSIANLRTSDPL